jgi:tRNA A-37 threonylcarbamoyl transferase component Bud32
MPTSATANTIGNGWTVQSTIAIGGQAVISLVEDSNGRKAVAKKVRDDLMAERDAQEHRQRLLREARVLRLLGGAGAPRLLDHGPDHLIIELVEGATLEKRTAHRKPPWPAAEVLFLADQLLRALMVVHSNGVVHRDLKPRNVMVSDTGELRLIDFGLAHLERPGEPELTLVGRVIGTIAYMAPEQMLALRPVTPTADIWAAGAVMYYLLSGHTARDPAESWSEVHAQARMDVESGRSSIAYPLGVPEEVADLVLRALQPRPEQRWGSAEQMRDQIAKLRIDLFQWTFTSGTCPNCMTATLAGTDHECSALPGSRLGCVQCSSCGATLLGSRAGATPTEQPLLRVPPLGALRFCPRCGARLGSVDAALGAKEGGACDCGHYRCSDDSAFCVWDGKTLEPDIEVSLADDGADTVAKYSLRGSPQALALTSSSGDLETPILFAGARTELRYVGLASHARAWRVRVKARGHVEEAVELTREQGRHPGYRISPPAAAEWYEYTVFVDIADEPAELRFLVAPLPRAEIGIANRWVQPGRISPEVLMREAIDRPVLRIAIGGTAPVGIPDQCLVHAERSVKVWCGHSPLRRLDDTPLFWLADAAATGDLFVIGPWGLRIPFGSVRRGEAKPPRPSVPPSKDLADKAVCSRLGWNGEAREMGDVTRLFYDADGAPDTTLGFRFDLRTSPGGRRPRNLPAQVFLGTRRMPTRPEATKELSGYTRFDFGVDLAGADLRQGGPLGVRFEGIEWLVELIAEHPEPRVDLVDGDSLDSSTIIVPPGTNVIWQVTDPRFEGITCKEIERKEISAGAVAVTLEVLYPDFVHPVRRTVRVFELPEDLESRVVQEDNPLPSLAAEDHDTRVGVSRRPRTTVWRSTEATVHLRNNLAFELVVGAAGTLTRNLPLAGNVGVRLRGRARPRPAGPVRVRLAPGVRTELPVEVEPTTQCTSLELWDLRLRIESPVDTRRAEHWAVAQIQVEGVLEVQRPTLYFDFGTSYTSVWCTYLGRATGRAYENQLHEANLEFVRSRGLCLFDESGMAVRLEAPFGEPDAACSPESSGGPIRVVGHAVLEEIKSAFRLGRNYNVRMRRRGVAGFRQVEVGGTWAYQQVQHALARHIVDSLRVFPDVVMTALPIVLRGQQRQNALASLRRGFEEAIGRAYPQLTGSPVIVDATLDEATAAAIPALMKAGQSGRVIVIDVGGGTTDITVFQVEVGSSEASAPSSGRTGLSPRSIRCVGFDGIAAGGRWVTELIAATLGRKVLEFLEASGVSVQFVERSSWEEESRAASNFALLVAVAEDVKLALYARGSWTPSEAETARLLRLECESGSSLEQALSGNIPAPDWSRLQINSTEAFEGGQYRRFLADVVIRALHADDVCCSRERGGHELPKAVILTGQAAKCSRLEKMLKLVFGVAPMSNPTPKERKLAVVEGLRQYVAWMERGEEDLVLEVGNLDRAVLAPVGRVADGRWECRLRRLDPLCVPVEFLGGSEVRRSRDPRKKVLAPHLRLWARSDGQKPAFEVPKSLGLLDDRAYVGVLEQRDPEFERFSYCVWVSEDDELYGALFVNASAGWVSAVGVHFAGHLVSGVVVALVERWGDTMTADDIAAGGRSAIRGNGALYSWDLVCEDVASTRVVGGEYYCGDLVFPPSGVVLFLRYWRPGGGEKRVLPVAYLPGRSRRVTGASLVESAARHLVGRRIEDLPVVCGMSVDADECRISFCPDADAVVLGESAPVCLVLSNGCASEQWLIPVPQQSGTEEVAVEDGGLPRVVPDFFAQYRVWLRRSWLEQRGLR